MNRILTIVIGILTSLALAVPAHAATVKITDAVGDANAINDGIFLLSGCAIILGNEVCVPTVPSRSTPVDAASFDIKTVTVSTVKKGGKPYAMNLTLELSAAPAPAFAVYRVTGSLPQTPVTGVGGVELCSDVFFVEYYTLPLQNTSVRTCDPNDETDGYSNVTLPAAKVSGNKIIWTVPFTTLAARNIKIGAKLNGIGAHDRVATAVTYPQMDVVESTKTYTLGR